MRLDSPDRLTPPYSISLLKISYNLFYQKIDREYQIKSITSE